MRRVWGIPILTATALVAAIAVPAAAGGGFGAPALAGASWFQPQVPISSLARPALGLDLSRLQVSSTFSVGSSGFGGTDALQVTRLSYRFDRPVWMSVSLGNAWGQNAAQGSSMFLEGLQLGWQPTRNLLFQVEYRDVRSPLQYGTGFGQGPWRRSPYDPF